MVGYYNLRQLFYYKVRHGLLQIATGIIQSAIDLLQIATGITKCDDYYKLRQYRCWSWNWTQPQMMRLKPKLIKKIRIVEVVLFRYEWREKLGIWSKEEYEIVVKLCIFLTLFAR